jgi:hypothetical protein
MFGGRAAVPGIFIHDGGDSIAFAAKLIVDNKP